MLKDGELSLEDGKGPSSRILSNSSTDVACEGTSGIVESRPPPKESSSVKLAWISCKKNFYNIIGMSLLKFFYDKIKLMMVSNSL